MKTRTDCCVHWTLSYILLGCQLEGKKNPPKRGPGQASASCIVCPGLPVPCSPLTSLAFLREGLQPCLFPFYLCTPLAFPRESLQDMGSTLGEMLLSPLEGRALSLKLHHQDATPAAWQGSASLLLAKQP